MDQIINQFEFLPKLSEDEKPPRSAAPELPDSGLVERPVEDVTAQSAMPSEPTIDEPRTNSHVVDLGGMHFLDVYSLGVFLQDQNELTQVTFTGAQIGGKEMEGGHLDEVFNDPANDGWLSKVLALHFDKMDLSNEALALVCQKAKALESLQINVCYMLREEGLRALEQAVFLPSLKFLGVESTPISRKTLKEMGEKAEGLTVLQVKNCFNLFSPAVNPDGPQKLSVIDFKGTEDLGTLYERVSVIGLRPDFSP